MIEITSVGGYNEVGKNCTAIKIGNDAFVLDIGIYLESYIKLTQDDDIVRHEASDLIQIGAIPDISSISDWKDNLRMILPTHAHLDHIGGIPYLAAKLKAPIMCTPFTSEVLRAIISDKKIRLGNKISSMSSNSIYNFSDDIKIEFVHITHSTPHTVMIAFHTKQGIIIYANDFKFDLFPTLGKKPNFKRLEELGRKGVYALIVDSTYAGDARRMPSEAVAKQMLMEVMLGTDSKNKTLIATTFSSHIARLSSMVEFGKKLNRKVVFLGRSLAKYSYAAEKSGIINFSKDVEMVKYSSQIKKRLRQIYPDRHKYLLVVTGHQGEPGSTLSKIANGEFKFSLGQEDHIIFSCKTIPTPTNIENRARLEAKLKGLHTRIFTNVHESGHAAREDLRDLINILKPKHIIPAHGNDSMKGALAELAVEMGYKNGNNVHMMRDGQRIKI